MSPEWEKHAESLIVRRWGDNEKSVGRTELLLRFGSRKIKPHLLKALYVGPIAEVVRYAETVGVSDEELAQKLGLDRGTPRRWLVEEHDPDPYNFLGVVTFVLETTLQQLPPSAMASRERIIRDAVRSVVATIRSDLSDCKRAKPSDEELACVKMFLRHPYAGEFVPGNKPAKSQNTEALFVWILRELQREFRSPRLITSRAIWEAIGQWAAPFAVFLIGVDHIPKAEALDELTSKQVP